MTLRLKGSTSGHTEVKAPASAGSNTLTLPTGNGSAEQFLKNSGTAGELEFSSMVETSTGVGIGTTSPSKKLHIVPSGSNAYDAVQIGDGLYLGNTSNNNNAALFHQGGGADLEIGSQQHITFTTGNIAGSATERLRIDSSGKVAIGGTVVTDSNLLNLQGSSASVNIGVVLNDTNTSKIYGIQNGGSALKFFDYTASAERLRIDSSGNVGIGTSSFDSTSSGRQILEINGTSSSLINLDVGGTRKAYHFTDGTNVYSYNTANGNYIFGTNNAERLRILSSGGLTFNGDTAAANALDDYEEGTWTPGVTFNNNAAGMTYSRQHGHYTKIGNIVYLKGHIQITNIGTSTGAARLTGIPFTGSGTPNTFTPIADRGGLDLGSGKQGAALYLTSDTPAFYGYSFDGSGNFALQHSNFNNNIEIDINYVYRVG